MREVAVIKLVNIFLIFCNTLLFGLGDNAENWEIVIEELAKELQGSNVKNLINLEATAAPLEEPEITFPLYAHCLVQSNEAYENLETEITGTVDIRQMSAESESEIWIKLSGFTDADLHGFHIHEHGDLSDSCDSLGSHYNPYEVDHGSPENDLTSRHIGDLGNIQATGGVVDKLITDQYVKLYSVTTVYGRSFVIHEGEDDLGLGDAEDSLTTGAAGARLACCVIGHSDDKHWAT